MALYKLYYCIRIVSFIWFWYTVAAEICCTITFHTQQLGYSGMGALCLVVRTLTAFKVV